MSPLSPSVTHRKRSALSRRWGCGGRRLREGQAARLASPCVPDTEGRGRAQNGVCASSLPPSTSPNPAQLSGPPARSPVPTSSNPSACLSKACGIKSLQHRKVWVPWGLVRGQQTPPTYPSLPLGAVSRRQPGTFSVPRTCFPLLGLCLCLGMCLFWKRNLTVTSNWQTSWVLPTSAFPSLPQRGLRGLPEGEPPAMLPALLFSLVGSAHPSTFPELQLCESKAKGSLGEPCVPSM